MNKYVVTFDKSNEDVPTLIVARESCFSFTPSLDIVRVITGEEAVDIWNRLERKVEVTAQPLVNVVNVEKKY